MRVKAGHNTVKHLRTLDSVLKAILAETFLLFYFLYFLFYFAVQLSHEETEGN